MAANLGTFLLAKRLERKHGFRLAQEDYQSEASLQSALTLFERHSWLEGFSLTPGYAQQAPAAG